MWLKQRKLRERKYLQGGHDQLVSLSGRVLHDDLLDFVQISNDKRLYRIDTTLLNEDLYPSNKISHPVYITPEDEQ